MRRSKSVGFIRSVPALIISLAGTWTRTCYVESISDEHIELSVDGGPLDFDFAQDSNEFYLVLSSGELPVYRHCDMLSIMGQRIHGRLTGKPFNGYTEAKPEVADTAEEPEEPKEPKTSPLRRHPSKRVLGASVLSRRRRRDD